MSVLVETTLGDMVIDLFTRKTPNAAMNFIRLAKLKYYDGCNFFSVQKDYIALTGNQSNHEEVQAIRGLNKYYDDHADKDAQFNCKGLVATLSLPPNQNISEFLITLSNQKLASLNNQYTIFGKVVKGIDVVDKINNTPCNCFNHPLCQIIIKQICVLAEELPDSNNISTPTSPPPSKKKYHERLDPDFVFHIKNQKHVNAKCKTLPIKSKDTDTFLIEDCRNIQTQPPDNVLFVCKLNPATKEDDLIGVFSRFGKIISCQIMRDAKTNDSLQYAFIEYEKKENCKEALNEMDNNLLDGRRIHAEYSQSVASLWVEYSKKKNCHNSQTLTHIDHNKLKSITKAEVSSVPNCIYLKYPKAIDSTKLYSLSSSNSSDSQSSSRSISSSSCSSCSRSYSSYSKSSHRQKRSRSRSHRSHRR
jgi:peptidyl-prolyl cis-trans isomerase-like 4